MDEFRLEGPLSTVGGVRVGYRFRNGWNLETGLLYRKNNFNAVYQHDIQASEILKLQQSAAGTSFSYSSKLPSLAGGIATTLLFEKENHEGRLTEDVPLEIELAHQNAIITVPLELGYIQGITDRWSVELNSGMTYNRRRSSIDTSPGDISLRSDLDFKDVSFTPVPQEIDPYKKHVFGFSLGSSIQFRLGRMEMGIGYNWDRVGTIYRDAQYSVKNQSHTGSINLRYYLK